MLNLGLWQFLKHSNITISPSPGRISAEPNEQTLFAMQDEAAVQKTYIARVLGCFPKDPVTVHKHLAWDSRQNHAFLMEPDGKLAEQQSMGKVPEPTQSQGLQAKAAQTDFRLLAIAADGKTSLVECQPKTGRTHQIRHGSRCSKQLMWLQI